MSIRNLNRRYRKKLFWLISPYIVILLIFIFPSCATQQGSVSSSAGLKAAIIDQLSDTQPNASFIQDISGVLSAYGFTTVDVYSGKDTDINLYLRLPESDYKLIILRVHSGLLYENGDIYQGSWLFTNEPCNQDLNHADERLSRKIAKARIDDSQPWVYAIGSDFVSGSMQGSFDHTLVLAMGCYSFMRDDLAEAFVGKGAGVYIGWDTLVNLDYTDRATEILASNLCEKAMPLNKALENTASLMGPEPSHGSQLQFYPPNAGDWTLSTIINR